MDAEEESGARLDLAAAEREFEKQVVGSSLPGQSATELSSWVDQLGSFVLLERAVVKAGYGNVSSLEWYQAKCVDVRWGAYQLC